MNNQALMVAGAFQLSQNNKVSKALSDVSSRQNKMEGMQREMNAEMGRMSNEMGRMADGMDQLAEGMDRMARAQERQEYELKKQTRMHEIEAERKEIERVVKEAAFQLRRHLKVIEGLKSPLDRFFMYRATAFNLDTTHIKTENIDSIEEKTFLVDTMESLHKNVTESFGEIPEHELEDLMQYQSTSSKTQKIESLLADKEQTKNAFMNKAGQEMNELKQQHAKLINEEKELSGVNYGDGSVSWWKLLFSEYRIKHDDKIKGHHMMFLCLGSLIVSLFFKETVVGMIFFVISLIALALAVFTLIRFIKRKSTTFLNEEFKKEVVGREEAKKQEELKEKERLRTERLETLKAEIDSIAEKIKELQDSQKKTFTDLMMKHDEKIMETMNPAKSLKELEKLKGQFIEKRSAINDFIDVEASLSA